jgi:hypothetical protein
MDSTCHTTGVLIYHKPSFKKHPFMAHPPFDTRRWRAHLSWFLLLIALSACTDELDKLDDPKLASGEPDWAVPLLDTRLTAGDIAEVQDNEDIRVYPDGRLYFVYADSFATQPAAELLFLEDELLPGATFTFASGGPQEVSRTLDELGIEFDQVRPRRILFSGGRLALTLRSTIPTPTAVDIRFPTTETPGGAPFSVSVDLPAARGTVERVEQVASLNQSLFRLEENNNIPEFASLPAELSFRFEDPSQLSGLPSEFITLQWRIVQPQFGYLVGEFLPFFIYNQSNRSIEISLFDGSTIRQEDVSLFDPRIIAEARSTFGLPTRHFLSGIIGFKDGLATAIEGVGLEQLRPLRIPAADPPPQGFAPEVRPRTEEVRLDRANTSQNGVNGIVDVVGEVPDSIRYSANGSIDGIEEGFVLDSSRIRVRVRAEIPFDGTLRRLTFTDTIADLDLPDDEDEAGVEGRRALLALIVDNNFPLQAEIQGFFTTESGVVVDSLFLSNDTATGPVYGGALVRGAAPNDDRSVPFDRFARTVREVVVERERYDRLLESADRLVLQVTANSTDAPLERNVLVRERNSIRVRLGVRASAFVDPEQIDE